MPGCKVARQEFLYVYAWWDCQPSSHFRSSLLTSVAIASPLCHQDHPIHGILSGDEAAFGRVPSTSPPRSRNHAGHRELPRCRPLGCSGWMPEQSSWREEPTIEVPRTTRRKPVLSCSWLELYSGGFCSPRTWVNERSNQKVTGASTNIVVTCMPLIVLCGTVNDGDRVITGPPEPKSRALWQRHEARWR